MDTLLADMGFYSEKHIQARQAVGIDPLIAVARDTHHPDWRQRHCEPAPLSADASTVQAMSHRLQTQAGRAL